MVSRIRSCFPAASPCRREGRLFLSFLKKTRAAREVAGLAESFARGPAAVVLCASAGGARVCSGHAQRCACAGLSLANHRARAHTVLNALGLECASVLCCRWAGEPRDRACAGEGNTEAGEAAVVLTRSVMRWHPTARGISLACGRLVVGTGPRSDGGPHTPERARGENTGMQQGGGGLDANCHALATGAVHPSSRARVEAPSGKRKPRGVRRRANPQRVRLRHEGGRRCTSARSRSAHNAHRDAHAHTRARVGGSLARMWPLSAVRGGRGRV